jgi:hypothetical protein
MPVLFSAWLNLPDLICYLLIKILILRYRHNGKRNKIKISMGHLNWKGEWISDESPFDKASEYSLKQDLIKELLEVVKKYQGRVKDKTIAEAANEVVKKFKILK